MQLVEAVCGSVLELSRSGVSCTGLDLTLTALKESLSTVCKCTAWQRDNHVVNSNDAISQFMMPVAFGLPVAKLKLMPKKRPDAKALFRPHFSTLFTATSYLSHAACSFAKDRTCNQVQVS